MKDNFFNANEAFEYLQEYIAFEGIPFDNTKAIFNCGFYLDDPSDKNITATWRKWKKEYAEAEWQWYLSGDPSIKKLGDIYGKIPTIWENMSDENGTVRSNYGWQWQRNHQIDYVVNKLKSNPNTRHAAISIYDCKEHNTYEFDTPCTYAVQFTILNDKLNMSVYMRSNDLWYGFCNDQYQFASLQELIAERLNMDIGWYYHHAHNMHLYNDKL